jgi:preprotein translocase subunit SecA
MLATGGGAPLGALSAPELGDIPMPSIENEVVQRDGPKVGRNDPCPCGSGKKYKHCHGQLS